MIKHCTITRTICALIVITVFCALVGCSKSSENSNSNSQAINTCNSLPTKSDSTSLSQSQIQEDISKAQAGQSILLPDGKKWDGTPWNGLYMNFLVMGLKSDAPITSIIGNHAELVSQEEVAISTGSALLVLVDRTPPAAEEAKTGKVTHSFEYWLIQNELRPYPERQDMKLVYVLFATFNTTPSIARSNILKLAKGWEISVN